MEEIVKVIRKAKAVIIYNEGCPYQFKIDTNEYKSIMGSWERMTENALQMPAFGVSIDEHTREELKKGMWIEFLFGEEHIVQEMPFEKLLIGCRKDFRGFNLVRYWDGKYFGRCFYLDLREKTMQDFCECLEKIIRNSVAAD